MRQFSFAGILLVVALGWATSAFAVVVDTGVWAIDMEKTLDTCVTTCTTGSFGGAVPSELPASYTTTGKLNQAHALGVLYGGYGENCGISLGDNGDAAATQRGKLGFTLSGRVLTDVAGANDIFVAETGSPGSPEAYMVRVSTNGGATFSSWQYDQARVECTSASTGKCDAITGFDFVKDFGLASTDTVNLVEIQNCNLSDKVIAGVYDSANEGTVVFSGDANYSSASELKTGTYICTSSTTYATSKYDADPTYIFYGGSSAVPEPSSLVMIVLGVVSALAWAIKGR